MNSIDWNDWYHNDNDFTGEVIFYGGVVAYSIKGKVVSKKEFHDTIYKNKLEDLLND